MTTERCRNQTAINHVGFEVVISRSCYLLHAGFLFGLFFDPEDGGDMFFRNVG
jgi:hypothetical protein